MKIGIYGGTFDPPHLGHMEAARTAMEQLGLDRLLIIPDREPPHKELEGNAASPEQRLEMARLMADGLGPRAEASDLELKREGKIRHFGISFHDKAEVLDMILTEHPEIEVVQIQFNYVDYEDASVESKKVYEVCEKHGKPVIVMEPVKGGSLVNLPSEADRILRDLNGGSNASYALRFAASFPQMAMVLSGMSDMAQMTDNLSAMADFKPLSNEEMAAVRRVNDIFHGLNLIPCTSCRYCVEENECPKGIRIPDMFASMNAHEAFHNWNTGYYYNSVITGGDHGKASDCLQCGKCEKVCPQHLPIRELLKNVAKTFEG